MDDGPRICPVTGKQQLTKATAKRAARNMNSHQQRDRWPVHAYPCPKCGTYHTGHIPGRQRRQRRRRDS